jgi:hypothetical protein
MFEYWLLRSWLPLVVRCWAARRWAADEFAREPGRF